LFGARSDYVKSKLQLSFFSVDFVSGEVTNLLTVPLGYSGAIQACTIDDTQSRLVVLIASQQDLPVGNVEYLTIYNFNANVWIGQWLFTGEMYSNYVADVAIINSQMIGVIDRVNGQKWFASFAKFNLTNSVCDTFNFSSVRYTIVAV